MEAFEALVEHVCRGRWDDARRPTAKELGATLVLRLDLGEASAKVREGGPKDTEEDMGLPVWAGVLPLRTRPLPPVREPGMAETIATPAYVSSYARPGWTP